MNEREVSKTMNERIESKRLDASQFNALPAGWFFVHLLHQQLLLLLHKMKDGQIAIPRSRFDLQLGNDMHRIGLGTTKLLALLYDESEGLPRTAGSGPPVDDGGPGRTRDTVVVRLAEAADGADVGLGQVVHGQVAEALLRYDHVRLVLGDLGAGLGNPVLLQLQQRRPASGQHLDAKAEHRLDVVICIQSGCLLQV